MSDGPLVMFVVFPLGAYLLGSIPFGVIIARAHGVDLRAHGSGNIGATNVGRVLGRKWGCLCFVLDVLKGFVPVLLVGLYLGRDSDGLPSAYQQAGWLAVAFGAIAGHVFSLWMRFRGGKGVATSLGVLMGFFPYFTWPALAALALWVAVVLAWRYVSLASVTAAAAFPLLFLAACLAAGWPVGRLWPLLAFAAAMAALVIVRHRSNLARLLAGTENRIGRKNPPAASR
ncbi:MAG: acyl-phosphate glycerol 3-phosphate acyltransferase [Planctomycetales bacterium 4484_123]|nr:MAG: acyl-phosphate glycerol 3-phosphate acyltransferase [Planctomycetales bacterium 4484_123]